MCLDYTAPSLHWLIHHSWRRENAKTCAQTKPCRWVIQVFATGACSSWVTELHSAEGAQGVCSIMEPPPSPRPATSSVAFAQIYARPLRLCRPGAGLYRLTRPISASAAQPHAQPVALDTPRPSRRRPPPLSRHPSRHGPVQRQQAERRTPHASCEARPTHCPA